MASIWFRTGLVAVVLAFGSLFVLISVTRAELIDVKLNARPATVTVARGVKMRAWTFNGTVPGPLIRATEGDTVRVTLKNSHKGIRRNCRGKKKRKLGRCLSFNRANMAMHHSVDFHAARIAPDVAFKDVAPGKSLTFEFEASTPGVFMYHCATGPMLQHLGMGMQGMIVVDPATPRPPAREVFLVQSEYYGKVKNGSLKTSYEAMRTDSPTYVVFNGRSYRYAEKPIPVKVGELVRIYFLDSGPSRFSAFHVVGTIFDSYEHDGQPGETIHNVSTQTIAPGGAGIFETTFPEAGSYPFVSHSVIDMDRGAMGTFQAS